MDTVYLIFLIFCATLFQAILTFSEEHTDKSWDLHIRKKRIIDKTLNGNRPVTIQNVPYIVNIRKNGIFNCAGSILTSTVIITAAQCVYQNDVYTVLSGSDHVDAGIQHRVTGKLIHHLFKQNTKESDIALLHISSPINLIHSQSRRIELYQGNVPDNVIGTFSGWGCNDESGSTHKYPKRLRSIAVPILKLETCKSLYSYPNVVTDGNICTYDTYNNKCGSSGDFGGPLVVNGKLVGIFSFTRRKTFWDNPDVFFNVAHPLNRNWIIANVHIIENWR